MGRTDHPSLAPDPRRVRLNPRPHCPNDPKPPARKWNRRQTRHDSRAHNQPPTPNHYTASILGATRPSPESARKIEVKDLDETKIERVEEVDLLARKAADAGALVDLYFSKSAREASAKASRIVTDMHGTRLRGGLKGRDVIEGNDNEAKAARDELVIQLRRELGEPAVS